MCNQARRARRARAWIEEKARNVLLWLLRLGSWEDRRSPSSPSSGGAGGCASNLGLGTGANLIQVPGNSQLSSLIRTEIES